MSTEVHPVDEILPVPRLLALGLQHVLVMYAGAVAVVAISVGFGLIPLAAPGFFRNLPHDLQPLLESGILLCAVVAVLLNAFFNGLGGSKAAEADAAATASSAQHV